MLGRTVGLAALCALGTSAILLPPGIATDDPLALNNIVNPKEQRIQLPCPACAFTAEKKEIDEFSEESDDLFWIQGGEYKLLLDFTVSDDGQRLQLNGEPIYPPHFHRDAYFEGRPMHVDQVPAYFSSLDAAPDGARRVPLEVTSSSLKVDGLPATVGTKHGGDSIFHIRFRIIGLEKQPMDLDEVEILLLQTGDGELLILRLDNAANPSSMPFPAPPSPQSPRPTLDLDDVEGCSRLPPSICRFKKTVEAKLEAMRHGRYGSSRPCSEAHGPPFGAFSGVRPHDMNSHGVSGYPHGRPHHIRPFETSHYGHHREGLHALARAIIAVLIPVTAGITVGLTVSLLGLLAGRLVGWVWSRLTPGRQRCHNMLDRQQRRAEEGKILLSEDDTEPLPVYEEAPPYEVYGSDQK
ncbi:hypothetical protein LTR37_002121 [Vermiconidia calcicola]|uniref:Uncharacterized protein n=1 Tax=Vermiconidia calcicola TaxID=1690605 RepID=A0ACC3NV26_9PEZI|nr:hypothetical protein LTR37_002121 [Vermiconidia calcicola]